LGLGSGGFDVVHVNVSKGLSGEGTDGAEVMKLNYTSLQHAIVPVEGESLSLPLERPVAVLALHGQLAPLAWAFAHALPGSRLGYVQTEGGALPGGHSRTARELRERDLLSGHITAGAAFGGDQEAMTTAGAIHHGLCELSWDAVVCGPGAGIVGWRPARVDLPAFAASGLEAQTRGRGVTQDPLFFGAALAGGEALAELLAAGQHTAPPMNA